eukprot:gene2219-2423_t
MKRTTTRETRGQEDTLRPKPRVSTSGAGKGGRGESEKKRKTRSLRAGLLFPVGRIAKYLKQGKYASRIGVGAAVYLSSILEYLTAEVLELSGNAARDHKKNRIIPRHIQLAVRNDDELNKLFGNVTIAQGGVIPHIHTVLIPKHLKEHAVAIASEHGAESESSKKAADKDEKEA